MDAEMFNKHDFSLFVKLCSSILVTLLVFLSLYNVIFEHELFVG